MHFPVCTDSVGLCNVRIIISAVFRHLKCRKRCQVFVTDFILNVLETKASHEQQLNEISERFEEIKISLSVSWNQFILKLCLLLVNSCKRQMVILCLPD